jgi:hypothetical protein
MIVGEAMSYLGDYSKATVSAAKIFKLIYDVPPIDAYSDRGLKEVGFLVYCFLFAFVKFFFPLLLRL